MKWSNLGLLIWFGFGVFFLIYGGRAIIRRQFSFRYGKGYGSLPITLEGDPAIISGIIVLIGGLLILIPMIRALALGNLTPDDRLVNILGGAGLGTVFIGIFVGSIFQAAINLGELLREKVDRGRG